MNTKEKVVAILEKLPADCTVDDVLYHLYVVQAIERGLADVAAGRTIPHEEVEEQMRKNWLLDTE